MKHTPETSLVRSLASESLAESLSNVADTSLDAAIDSGVLDGIPVIGLLTGVMKATREIRETIFLRKIARFLQEISLAPIEERRSFVERFEDEKQQHRFGEAIILLLDRADDMGKPRIVGRIVRALALGDIEYRVGLRLARMVDRCYLEDLELLKRFVPGTQGDMTSIAETLFSAGFLTNTGFDGGDAAGKNAGATYALNEYAELLVKYGLV